MEETRAGPVKRLLPRSLYGRATLILLLPVLFLLTVGTVVFVQRHFEDVTRQMTANVTLVLRFLHDEAEAAPDGAAAAAALERIAGPLALTVILPSQAPMPGQADHVRFYDVPGRAVIETLRAQLPQARVIDLVRDRKVVHLWMDTRHGALQVSFPRRRVSASNPHQYLVLLILSGGIMTLISFIFLRNQVRPIRALAQAATAFGKGQKIDYRPSGATEVRQAGSAFLDMRRRIERQIEQRTIMLSGISHDMRTPLTRMRLALSLMEDSEEVRDLSRDVVEMDRMLEEFLHFTRDGSLDAMQEIDPEALLRDVAEKAARGGADVAVLNVAGQGRLKGRPTALARALGNLAENGLKHGSRVRMSLSAGERSVVFTVEDDGPGIPEARRDEALRPFARLDPARNQNRGGGVGLGLAITHDIARQHGGALVLSESEALGGLRADIVVPR